MVSKKKHNFCRWIRLCPWLLTFIIPHSISDVHIMCVPHKILMFESLYIVHIIPASSIWCCPSLLPPAVQQSTHDWHLKHLELGLVDGKSMDNKTMEPWVEETMWIFVNCKLMSLCWKSCALCTYCRKDEAKVNCEVEIITPCFPFNSENF